MSTKKRLVIHFGLPRTGTTSIQTFLKLNRSKLEQIGVLYPNIDPQPYIISQGESPRLWTESTLRVLRSGANQAILGFAAADSHAKGKHGQLKIDKAAWTDFLENFIVSHYHTAIISYENFGGNPQSFDLSAFKQTMARLDVVGIIYLRQFESWITSLFDHSIGGPVRFGGEFAEFSFYRMAKNHTYITKIDNIKEIFYLNEIIVKNFDEISKSNSLLSSFLSSLGLLSDDLKNAIAAHSRRNASLSPSQTLFLHLLNGWRVSDADFTATRAALLRSSFGKGRPDPYSIAPAESLSYLRNLAASDALDLLGRHGVDMRSDVQPQDASPAPHRLSRESFDEILDAIAPQLRPELINELRRRFENSDNG